MTHKQCQSCLILKPLDAFRQRGLGRDHNCNHCKLGRRYQAAAQVTASRTRYRHEVATLTAKHRRYLAARAVVGGGE